MIDLSHLHFSQIHEAPRQFSPPQVNLRQIASFHRLRMHSLHVLSERGLLNRTENIMIIWSHHAASLPRQRVMSHVLSAQCPPLLSPDYYIVYDKSVRWPAAIPWTKSLKSFFFKWVYADKRHSCSITEDSRLWFADTGMRRRTKARLKSIENEISQRGGLDVSTPLRLMRHYRRWYFTLGAAM